MSVAVGSTATRAREAAHRRLAWMGRVVATAGLGVAVTLAGVGVEYLIRGSTAAVPGPYVREVLPLDDLAKLGSLRLPAYLAVWVAASALLGRFAARRRLGRFAAPAVLGLSVGATLAIIDTISLFSVRQVPMTHAVWLMTRLRTVSPPMLLAAVAGALAARGSGGHVRMRIVLAWLAAAVGILDLVSTVIPHGGGAALLRGILPVEVPRVASAATVAAGAGLLVVARGLARGNHRAWALAVGLAACSSILHLLKGLDQPEAIASGIVVVLLLTCRGEFDADGDPDSRTPALTRSTMFLVGIYAYGAIALFVNRAVADQAWSPSLAIDETSRAMLGLGLRRSAHFGSGFGAWFPLSVALLATLGVVMTLAAWLRPWRHRHLTQEPDRAEAERLVRTWGRDALAPFTLRHDKEVFLSPDGDAFLAYAVRSGVALVSGDPVGPPESIRPLLESFLRFAHARGWRIAILGASHGLLPTYRELELGSLYWGDEAVADTTAFSLDGRAIRKVRQSVHRLERAGYRLDVRYADDLDDASWDRLEEVDGAWANGALLGYAMSFEDVRSVSGHDAVFAIGRDAHGDPRGFLHLAVFDGGRALSLSTMPRDPNTPNGFNEWLIAGTIAWAREHGFAAVSLNFAPFAQLLEPGCRLRPRDRLVRRALLLLKACLGLRLDNLLRFADHFRPRWQPRYVVFERPLDLPRVGVAGLRAEGYLGRRPPP